MTVRALIVEDEPLAIDRLRACLAYAEDVELIGEARDGQVAQDLINRLQPDLVFLDIQLPLMSGFEVLRSIRHRPGVIFTTAHNEYAVSAFEWGAFDYLLKPFDRERIALALKRYQQRSGLKDSGETMAERLDTTESHGQLRRFFVKQRGVALPVDTNDVVAIIAEGDYCRVNLFDETHLVHLPLRDFEARLNPDLFRRIHRSALVNTAKIERVEAIGRGAQVTMVNGLKIGASRAGVAELKSLHL